MIEGAHMKQQREIILPIFDLQTHYNKVTVPQDFDLRDLAKKYSVFPLRTITQNGRKRLLLAMRNPFDHKATLDVEFRAGMTVIPVQADESDIQWLMQVHYYGRRLSPTPTTVERPVIHDMFSQFQEVSDAQSQPDWIGEILQPFTVKD
jgi:hypothetical protein